MCPKHEQVDPLQANTLSSYVFGSSCNEARAGWEEGKEKTLRTYSIKVRKVIWGIRESCSKNRFERDWNTPKSLRQDLRLQASASKIADTTSDRAVERTVLLGTAGRDLDIFTKHERKSRGYGKKEVTLPGQYLGGGSANTKETRLFRSGL